TIEFETTEVTDPDVALSPDGEWLIFTMLGHLFRLPVEGGEAEQLTFGPYYDTDVEFSPNGDRVAFVSDRDGSEGNVFVLELATGEITQVTHEPWAGRPSWTPDGEAIVYLRFVREAFKAETWHSMPALVRRVALATGEPETLSSPPRLFRSVAHLPDGRLAWSVIEPDTGSPRLTTRIELMSPEGAIDTLRTVPCYADRLVASPIGDGLYLHCSQSGFIPGSEGLVFLPVPEGAEREVAHVVSRSDFAPRGPLFAIAADNESLYVGQAGQLWKISLPAGSREPISLHARVSLEVRAPTAPQKLAVDPGSSRRLRSVLSPRLSPDGRTLVFVAAGHIWEQPLDGGSARRLFEGRSLEREPVFSPDGKRLAFVRDQNGAQELSVFDFESRQTRTLASGLVYLGLSWSPDGERVLFAQRAGGGGFLLVAVRLSDGKRETLGSVGRWSARPHLSADGEWLYWSDNGALYRRPLAESVEPEPVTDLAHHLSDGLVSPDGKWLVFRRNAEIWVAPLGKELVREEDVRRLGPDGGDTFAFTPDGEGLIYAVGGHVWRRPIAGGVPEEIPVRLEATSARPSPVLLRRVRLLDFGAGSFGPETSLFIDQGRIRWVGPEPDRPLPSGTVTIDAGGRFGIPGLFDMHVHVSHRWVTFLEAFLAYGITSVRVPGAWHTWLNSLAEHSDAASDPVPRYFWADFLEGLPPIGGDVDLLIENEDEARTHVRRSKDWGADFIKVYPSLSWPLQRAVAEEARRMGLPVAGHGTSAEEVIRSVILGYAWLEHNTDAFDDIHQMLALVGTRWVPTLSAAGGVVRLVQDEPDRLEDPKFRAFVPEWCFSPPQSTELSAEYRRLQWARQQATTLVAHRRGVRLYAGTDFGCFYGASLHWELEFLVEAGLSPLEVLRIATQEAATAVGAEDDLGTLEPGKLADIVLLDANPLEDIKNTQTIWRVIKGGWVFNPEELRPAEASAQKEPDALAARDVTGKWILTVDLGDVGSGEATFELKRDGATRSPERIPGLSAKPKSPARSRAMRSSSPSRARSVGLPTRGR
ncbi:MAG: PD40 domain-containing protein, partial [Gemmatimonadetes bacterium]|nr:PD40 domain-containing protein [Gemmatimonadota bacterium]